MSQQRFEGTSLEAVLADVRARHGDEAAIVEANRLRRGGIAGFFAKERYEVVVDVVDDDDHPPSAPTEIPAEFGLAATEDFCDRLISLADGVSDLDGTAELPPAPPISTEQPQFSAVLDSITRHMGSQPPASAPSPAIHAGLARLGLPEDITRAAIASPVLAGA